MTTTGTVQVWVTPNPTNINSPVSKIVITGVIGDYGTATSINKNGTVDDNGNYVKIALQQGGFEVNSSGTEQDHQQRPTHDVQHYDLLGCVRWLWAGHALQRHWCLRRYHRYHQHHREVRRYRGQVHQWREEGPVQYEQQRPAGRLLWEHHRYGQSIVQLRPTLATERCEPLCRSTGSTGALHRGHH